MKLTKNGLTFHVDDAEVTRLVLERFNAEETKIFVAQRAWGFPRIGAEVPEWGGVFAGAARATSESESDYYLIVGPESAEELKWSVAVDWAAGIKQHGFADFSLPRRKEQALLFANVADLFKPEWYWSSTQHAACSNLAWAQGFSYGFQSHLSKGDDGRARAVRRIPIQ